jgi:hypothetical protein
MKVVAFSTFETKFSMSFVLPKFSVVWILTANVSRVVPGSSILPYHDQYYGTFYDVVTYCGKRMQQSVKSLPLPLAKTITSTISEL